MSRSVNWWLPNESCACTDDVITQAAHNALINGRIASPDSGRTSRRPTRHNFALISWDRYAPAQARGSFEVSHARAPQSFVPPRMISHPLPSNSLATFAACDPSNPSPPSSPPRAPTPPSRSSPPSSVSTLNQYGSIRTPKLPSASLPHRSFARPALQQDAAHYARCSSNANVTHHSEPSPPPLPNSAPPTRHSCSGSSSLRNTMDANSPSPHGRPDRKSTRLNSSHMSISYAVFC